MRKLVLTVAVAAIVLPGSGAVAASPSFRLTIAHYLSGCHVWQHGKKTFGPAAKVVLQRGTRLEIRPNCPMDFDFRQVAGPKLALGAERTYAGTIRTIVFRKAGVYKLVAVNVQSSEERDLETLGPDNVLSLTIVVR